MLLSRWVGSPILCLTLCSFLPLSLAQANAVWRHPLYAGDGDYWRTRTPVEIANRGSQPARGIIVPLGVGSSSGEIDLEGAAAESVRVCDASGTEVLFNIYRSDFTPVHSGAIPAGATLEFAIECSASATRTYYVYCDNPSAWLVSDFLRNPGLWNGGVEDGTGEAPDGWQHELPDTQHRTLWVEGENPHGGNRCLKTVIEPGAEPSWISTSQIDLRVAPGATYTFRGWVRAENVSTGGFAGWYLHVGNATDTMILNTVLDAGSGTYDWTELTYSFVAPLDADRITLGTSLWGTGTAWFDDASLQRDTPLPDSGLDVTVFPEENLDLAEVVPTTPWYDNNSGDDLYWDFRVPVRVTNVSNSAIENILVSMNLRRLTSRFGDLNLDSFRVVEDTSVVQHYRTPDRLLFEGACTPKTRSTYHVYFSLDDRITEDAPSGYSDLVTSPRNLVGNPGFETKEDGWPAHWNHPDPAEFPVGATMGTTSEALYGDRSSFIDVPGGSEPKWIGWSQTVPIQPGRTYLLGAWLRCEDIRTGVWVHADCFDAQWGMCKGRETFSVGPIQIGTTPWMHLSQPFSMPATAAFFGIDLTTNTTGKVLHDGVILVEVTEGAMGAVEANPVSGTESPQMWAVDPIAKVFRDDHPPRTISPLRISAARGEVEPLQLALRSPQDLNGVRVEVLAPTHGDGVALNDISIGVVEYVPIDLISAYHPIHAASWERPIPNQVTTLSTLGSDFGTTSDGWSGFWPDPIVPMETVDLSANQTQPIWLKVRVPQEGTPSGDYTGRIRLSQGGSQLAETPFTVHVWDFTLPQETHVAAILGPHFLERGAIPFQTSEERWRAQWRFMGEHRVCPNVVLPDPEFSYAAGVAQADFSEFDTSARFLFEELGMPRVYSPGLFFAFGWANPPAPFMGENPYPGEYPYEGADRAVLRPEYKNAYQACLRLYWEHMKANGWSDRAVVSICDEPQVSTEGIVGQLRALCDLVHEVDPAIPVYTSTWDHVPDWDGWLDVWGISHFGMVTPEKMEELRSAGDRLWFTTDGQMCIDTPWCGVERLLPWYCFKFGVEAYEFWGIDWWTQDPWKFGWHQPVVDVFSPTQVESSRFPNGDGFLTYPGRPVGHGGPIGTVRLEQAREGVEDYEYFRLLSLLIDRGRQQGRDVSAAEDALAQALSLVSIPNVGGLRSTQILNSPGDVHNARERIAQEIERLAASTSSSWRIR